MIRRPLNVLAAALITTACVFGAAKQKPISKKPITPAEQAQIEADIKALKPLRDFIGTWKGAGYPKKASAEGAWGETAEWAFDFSGGHAAMAVEFAEGKYFSDGKIVAAPETGKFTFIGRAPKGKIDEKFTGSFNQDKELVLEAEKPTENRPKRITFSFVAHGARLVMLYEGRNKDSGIYVRLAEVGYTRKGSGFGLGGSGGKECVVTGGHAGSTVTYNGKEYGLCCSGCKEEFNRDPEGVLRAYAARKEKEKKEAN
jgi:YHS domain-containing protein